MNITVATTTQLLARVSILLHLQSHHAMTIQNIIWQHDDLTQEWELQCCLTTHQLSSDHKLWCFRDIEMPPNSGVAPGHLRVSAPPSPTIKCRKKGEWGKKRRWLTKYLIGPPLTPFYLFRPNSKAILFRMSWSCALNGWFNIPPLNGCSTNYFVATQV